MDAGNKHRAGSGACTAINESSQVLNKQSYISLTSWLFIIMTNFAHPRFKFFSLRSLLDVPKIKNALEVNIKYAMILPKKKKKWSWDFSAWPPGLDV